VQAEAVNSKSPGIDSNRKRKRIDVSRVLSVEDFDKIKRLREELGKIKEQKGDGIFQPESLESYGVKRRHGIEERMKTVLEGRTKFTLNKHAGGLTNREKLRTKNPKMIQNSYRVKRKLQESGRKIQSRKNKEVKVLKHDLKKRRRI